jgi:hypothetical protein
MKKINIIIAITAMLFTLQFVPFISPQTAGLCPPAFAEDTWKQEMADICSKTDDSMTLSKDELKALLQRIEKLRTVIDALEETPRKVNLKRLEMCSNLFAFVLESKEAAEKAK